MAPIRRGDAGPEVREVRAALAALQLICDPTADRSEYDAECELAVREFQQRRGLIVDGVVGRETMQALFSARWRLGDRPLRLRRPTPMVGDDVAALQERLLEMGYDAGRTDGVFGPRTERALRSFQREVGATIDGVCGPATLQALRRLGRKVVGGRPQLMRETEMLRHRGPALSGKRVVVDAGHGGTDAGVTVDGVTEADLMADLADRFADRLTAAGAAAHLTRGGAGGWDYPAGSDSDRAVFANGTGADLLISLHVDAHRNPAAHGIATFHFGTGTGVSSTVGERLAGLVQREILARTGMDDCGVHPKTWDLLRFTTMPAVRVEVGYLTSPEDRVRLLDPHFRDLVAESLLVAVQRIYLTGELDPPTGTMRLPLAASR